MKWWRRFRTRLRRKLKGVEPGCPQWLTEPTLRNAETLVVTVAVGRNLLTPEHLGVVDRLVGEAASREAIRATRERCRAA